MTVLGMLAWCAAAVSLWLGARRYESAVARGYRWLAAIRPLADLAVLGALLPMVTTAWRRVALPYLSLLAIALGDALAVGPRVLGGHPGVAGQLMPVVAALLLGAAPWRMTEGFGTGWARRTSSSAAATVIAVLAACVATLVVIG